MTPWPAEAPGLTSGQCRQLLELVDQRFGIRGSDYGASRLEVAVQKLLPRSGCADITELLAMLRDPANQRWLFELVESLTVGETYFLRDPAQIAALRDTILPETITRRGGERRLTAWSAGCSTGEEVYTLAILLKERKLPIDWDVTLLGTDINRESLRIAREAAYPAWSFRATPAAIRDRYFESTAGGWRLTDGVRHMARFAWANLGTDPLFPPLTDIDLIMCRNVTIYFDEVATQRLYRALVGGLARGGWLMLGPSDPLPVDREGLERVEVAGTVLWRRTFEKSLARRPRVTPIGPRLTRTARPKRMPAVRQEGLEGEEELEAGLLALESGEAGAALDLLRRATFREPGNAVAQFALGRAYVATGDALRGRTALLQTRRLLAPLAGDDLVPGSDSLSVETVRQTVQTYLEELAA